MTQKIPTLLLERAALDELNESALADARSRYPHFDEALAALKKDNLDFFKAHPAERVVPQINAQLSVDKNQNPHQKSSLQRLAPAFGMVAAAACALLIFVALPSEKIGEEGIRLKGERAHLVLHRAGEKSRLSHNDFARQGDRLQISYVAGPAKYGAIFSLDGKGAVTRHFPKGQTIAHALDSDGRIALSESYVLDDAPRFERFFFITSSRTFRLKEIKEKLEKLRSTQSLSLKDSVVQEFVLRK